MNTEFVMTSAGYLVAGLLVAVIVFDLRQARIPNVLVALLLGVFGVCVAFFLPLEVLIWRGVAAAIVFAIGFAAFAIRSLGAGDVKLLSVLALFVPTADLAVTAVLLSGCAIVTLTMMRLVRLRARSAQSDWAVLRDHYRYPLGPAIALAGLLYLLWGEAIGAALRGA
ncbi:MAG: A24 family peptidase [Sulfitobacter sp.]